MKDGKVLKQKPKKFPTWLKWFYGIFFLISIPLGLLVFAVASNEVPQKKPQSWQEWQKYRDQVRVFSKAITVAASATEMYVDANRFKELYSPNCPISDACAEFKGLMRVAADAARDGVLTPQELTEIAKSQVLLELTIKEKDAAFKKKFNK